MAPVKQQVKDLLAKLPEDCSLDDVLYHLYVLQAAEKGQADVSSGRVIPHDEVEKELRKKWVVGREK
jgi:hypothetical protein